jgi:hypothetical protein
MAILQQLYFHVMGRFALVIVILVALVSPSTSQDQASKRSPIVSLVLPSGIPSEDVQIDYFMGGSFGGYGDFVRTEKNRLTYNIYASVNGHPAKGIKVIAYLPGCEIATLDIPVLSARSERHLPCKPLASITLLGRILPVSMTLEEPTEVEVSYLAMWDHQFFGISDGMVTTIRLATVVPDDNGRFEVKLPDLYKQKLGDGLFQFLLRHSITGNIIASLRPLESDTDSDGLKVRSSYPPVMQFVAEKQ